MRKLIILFIVFILQIGSLFAQNDDDKELSAQEKMFLLMMKGSLSKAPEKDIIVLDSFSKPWEKDYAKIAKGAVELYNTLTLKYLNHFAIVDGQKVTVHDGTFQDKYLVECTLKEPAIHLDYWDSPYSDATIYSIEIDSNSLRKIAPFGVYKGYTSSHNKIEYSRRIKLDSLAGVDPYGKLKVKIKYLVGYDTVRINSDVEDKKYSVSGGDFTVMYCDNANVYIKEFPKGLFEDLIKLRLNVDGKLLKNKSKAFSLMSSTGTMHGSSLLLNRELVKLSDDEYIAQVLAFDMKSIDQSEVDKSMMIVILNDLDFDYIYFVFPRYKYMEKELKSTKVEEDVTDVKIHRTEVRVPFKGAVH